MTQVVVIVQARMGSTRLPGKVLKLIAGRPMLSYQLERLRRVKLATRIVVATTVNVPDDAIVALCAQEGVDCIRGSERDVLSRYCEAARVFNAEAIVRVTADCPLIDPELIDQAIGAYLHSGVQYDYVSNMLEPGWPYGMAVEVVSAIALAEAEAEARNEAEREHVTPFIYWRPERYRLKALTMTPDLSHQRWTVDTPEDFELISRILEDIYPREPNFNMASVLALLAEHPTWELINRHVPQKSAAQPSETT